MKNVVLPKIPSKLLQLAMDDLALIEKDERYTVNMSHWHHSWNSLADRCSVCLAGAVMAMTCKVPFHYFVVSTDYFEIENQRAFEAIDWFRQGSIQDAFDKLGLDMSDGSPARTYMISNGSYAHIPMYQPDPVRFRLAMNVLIYNLEKAGL